MKYGTVVVAFVYGGDCNIQVLEKGQGTDKFGEL